MDYEDPIHIGADNRLCPFLKEQCIGKLCAMWSTGTDAGVCLIRLIATRVRLR